MTSSAARLHSMAAETSLTSSRLVSTPGRVSMRQRGKAVFSPSRMLTVSSARPAAGQGPNIAPAAEASGPINAIWLTCAETGNT